VEGYFFDDTKLKDGRQLNVHDLDQVSKDHPVAVHHRGGHTSFYNSKALEMADVTAATPNPPGGTFDKDSSGALNGRVTDTAKSAFRVSSNGTENPGKLTRAMLSAGGSLTKKHGLTIISEKVEASRSLSASFISMRDSIAAGGAVFSRMGTLPRSGLRVRVGQDGIRLRAEETLRCSQFSPS